MATVRGRVLAYDQATGKGIIGSGNERHEFNLSSWKGEEVPALGKSVDIQKEEQGIYFIPVSDADIVKEKLELAGKSLASSGGNIASEALARLGPVTLIAMLAFFIGSLALDVVSLRVMGVSGGLSLYDFFSNASGFGKFLLIASWAALIVPLVWKEPKAYQALFVPLAPLVILFWKFWETYSAARQQMDSMSAFFGGKAAAKMPSFFDVVNPGPGFYLLIISAAILAFIAFARK